MDKQAHARKLKDCILSNRPEKCFFLLATQKVFPGATECCPLHREASHIEWH
jgi:hypothetical protein